MLRTELINVFDYGADGDIQFYTDDSTQSIRRKIYDKNEANDLNLDTGDENSLIGLNAYPCNVGLLTYDLDSNFTMGMAFSHPLTCNFLNKNTFELMLTRSVHNTDLKGKSQTKFIDNAMSELEIRINILKAED